MILSLKNNNNYIVIHEIPIKCQFYFNVLKTSLRHIFTAITQICLEGGSKTLISVLMHSIKSEVDMA